MLQRVLSKDLLEIKYLHLVIPPMSMYS
ncbi:hypothetical protein MTR67_018765 [Solanum verrucosum]|uniref:Uncharacterized protein n=1 Tax=Solanum verrucosum TaxID=315347 RepID=A0AAF0QQG5_SOLVR|nr:hypothetical protein MTR67_018765 [Solanum verrucosum]